jgi:hypothetical protein
VQVSINFNANFDFISRFTFSEVFTNRLFYTPERCPLLLAEGQCAAFRHPAFMPAVGKERSSSRKSDTFAPPANRRDGIFFIYLAKPSVVKRLRI